MSRKNRSTDGSAVATAPTISGNGESQPTGKVKKRGRGRPKGSLDKAPRKKRKDLVTA